MSSGLIYLQSSNFGVDKIKNGPVLCNSVKGFSVVLFYSQTPCPYSPHALNEFKKVVGTVNGVIFAVINIDTNVDVVRKSMNTLTPIEGVPYIMLYYNGIPQQIYPEDAPFTSNTIRDFSATVSMRLLNHLTKTSQTPTKQTPQKLIPKKNSICYVGKPVRKNVTYVLVDN